MEPPAAVAGATLRAAVTAAIPARRADGEHAGGPEKRRGAITLEEATAAALYRRAFENAVAPSAVDPPAGVVWLDGDSELLVRADGVRLRCRDGLVLVGVPVFTEQTGDTEVVVAFALADAGGGGPLTAATETPPRGPAGIVDRWGEAIVATAWHALVALASEVALAATADGRGAAHPPAPLAALPAALRFHVADTATADPPVP